MEFESYAIHLKAAKLYPQFFAFKRCIESDVETVDEFKKGVP